MTTLFIGLGHLLVAQVIGPPAQVGSKPSRQPCPPNGFQTQSATAPRKRAPEPLVPVETASPSREWVPNRLRQLPRARDGRRMEIVP